MTVPLSDGREVRVHDSGSPGDGAGDAALALLWHHGSPQTGALLAPLVEQAAARRIRLMSYARPSYGGSTPRPGRTVASAARLTVRTAPATGASVAVTWRQGEVWAAGSTQGRAAAARSEPRR